MTVTFSDIDGTLVHYPTGDAATPGEPFEDVYGSVTQESVHPGFQLYTDKVSCVACLGGDATGSDAAVSAADRLILRQVKPLPFKSCESCNLKAAEW